jgi:hypothetical protein
MPPDHNQQHSRRPHYHRGRRGPDRRGGDRRPPPQSQQQTETSGRDQLDIEQVMREIRSRISERHGIDLSPQQIQELAARRLEAILDPRTIKPSLMDELRRAAGLPADTTPSDTESEDTIDESALYQSDSGFMRGIRRLLNPLLKLFFNPAAIVDALNVQARRAKAAAAREAEQRRRQTEWNALHFEILRRLVTDIARVEIDNEHLAHRIESLSARVDFNDRRVRGLEHTQHQSRPSGRPPDAPVVTSPTPPPREEAAPSTEAPLSDTSAESNRRRRRRRRGRRSGQPRDISGVPTPGLAGTAAVDQGAEGDEFGDDDATSEDLTNDGGMTSTMADQPTVVDFEPSPPDPFEPSSPPSLEPPSPPPEEPIQVASKMEPVGPASESSPAPAPVEQAERPEPVPPEQS